MAKFEKGQEYEDMEYREKKGECMICGDKTNWYNSFDLPLCSEECSEKYWESIG